mmetsp:Transcript_3066/g.6609  ORF Transcript_3066/g.6609 Transcript_3066/m.6609 type:complete len:233 (+) Transcript_3066:109-807(+)
MIYMHTLNFLFSTIATAIVVITATHPVSSLLPSSSLAFTSYRSLRCKHPSPTPRHFSNMISSTAMAASIDIDNNNNDFPPMVDPSPIATTETKATDRSCNKETTTTTIPQKSNSKKLYTFAEARRIARGHGFDSREEFIAYTCPGAYQIPKNADEVWAEEWRGWDDFLGICLDFHEGREVARSLDDITTEQAYLYLFQSKSIPEDSTASRLPYRPDLKYKAEWKGWDDFLIG